MFPVRGFLSGEVGKARVKEYGFTGFLLPLSESRLPLGMDCKFVKKSLLSCWRHVFLGLLLSACCRFNVLVELF